MDNELQKKTFSQSMKGVFIAGILTCLPLVVTVYIILFLYRLLTRDVIPIIHKIANKFGYSFEPYILEAAALALVFILIFSIGLIAKAYIGKKVLWLLDKLVSHIPIARTIYSGTKQVIDSFSATTGANFSKVVLIEFPRRDMWMIGFVVKDAIPFMSDCCGFQEAYNVFVPTAPNPTSGFISIVAKSDVKEVDLSVEDGIKFVFSVGLVNLSPFSLNPKDVPVKK